MREPGNKPGTPPPWEGIDGGYREGPLCTLGALCAFFSVIEHLLPKPLPFFRIGLSNAPVMLGLFLDPKTFALLVVIKVLGAALLTGTLFSYVFLFSAAGSVTSAAVMFLLYRLGGGGGIPKRGAFMSFSGLGVTGALVSNSAQLVLARLFLFGRGTVYIAPPFILAGIVSGFALGLFCNEFSRRSHWYQSITQRAVVGGGGYYQSVLPPIPLLKKKRWFYFVQAPF